MEGLKSRLVYLAIIALILIGLPFAFIQLATTGIFLNNAVVDPVLKAATESDENRSVEFDNAEVGEMDLSEISSEGFETKPKEDLDAKWKAALEK